MLYQRPTFTCPASGVKTKDKQWDLAFLSKAEYQQKYGVTDEQYKKLAKQ